MHKQPSFQKYVDQWESQHKDFSISRSEDLWGTRMGLPAQATDPQRSSLFRETRSNAIKRKMNKYAAAPSQCSKWDGQEWSKHENWYRENESVLLAVPVTQGISRMSSSLPSSLSPPTRMSGDWTNFGRCCSFNSMEQEIKLQFSDDETNNADFDTPDIPYQYRSCNKAKKSNEQAHSIFELIKTHCHGNPMLMEKVVKWGVNHSKSNQMTRKNIRELTRGRYWITARSAQPHGDTEALSFKEELDDLTGGYQEVDNGVFHQPIPQGREAAVQHRLFKNNLDLWAIEKWEAGVWRPVARETLDRLWVDMRYHKTIHVKVIPLLSILERLREKFPAYQNIDKCVEFLFTSFDRKKLNGKLKTRNLKHNIANLKLKLEKQYALSFAVNVANTADCISNDDKEYSYSGGGF